MQESSLDRTKQEEQVETTSKKELQKLQYKENSILRKYNQVKKTKLCKIRFEFQKKRIVCLLDFLILTFFAKKKG